LLYELLRPCAGFSSPAPKKIPATIYPLPQKVFTNPYTSAAGRCFSKKKAVCKFFWPELLN
jgi:hypothetical protein